MENNNELKIHSVYEGIIVKYTDKGQKVVDGRELHEFLGVKEKFADWIKRQIENYNFEENLDFSTYSEKKEVGAVIKNVTDYLLTLDMAKELCMVSKTEKGREMRKYFIEIERKYFEEERQTTLETKLKHLRENAHVLPISTREYLEREIHELIVGGNAIRDKIDTDLSKHKFVVMTKNDNGTIRVKPTNSVEWKF